MIVGHQRQHDKGQIYKPESPPPRNLYTHSEPIRVCFRGRSPRQVEGPEGGEQVGGGPDGGPAPISAREGPADPQQTTHPHTADPASAQHGASPLFSRITFSLHAHLMHEGGVTPSQLSLPPSSGKTTLPTVHCSSASPLEAAV